MSRDNENGRRPAFEDAWVSVSDGLNGARGCFNAILMMAGVIAAVALFFTDWGAYPALSFFEASVVAICIYAVSLIIKRTPPR